MKTGGPGESRSAVGLQPRVDSAAERSAAKPTIVKAEASHIMCQTECKHNKDETCFHKERAQLAPDRQDLDFIVKEKDAVT